MPKTLARGINFHYQTLGEGPDVVLIHGISSSLASWYNGMFPSLAASGFRVTVYDMRGHGLSDCTESGYTSFEQAHDLKALLDVLGIKEVRIAGHSFGGSVAMHFARLFPEMTRGVVLLDTGLACLHHLRVIRGWQGWETPGMKEEGFTPEWFEDMESQNNMAEYLRRTLSAPRQRGFRKGAGGYTPRIKRLIEETKAGTEYRDVGGLTEETLHHIQTPVLGLYGSSTPAQNIAPHLATIMPHCRSVNMEGLGHFAALHDPQPILAYITPFFQDPYGYVEQGKAEGAQRTGLLEPPLQTSTSPLT